MQTEYRTLSSGHQWDPWFVQYSEVSLFQGMLMYCFNEDGRKVSLYAVQCTTCNILINP